MNIQIIGLGGVLIQAKKAGLISDVKSFLDMIGQKTNFYLGQKAQALILQAADEQP